MDLSVGRWVGSLVVRLGYGLDVAVCRICDPESGGVFLMPWRASAALPLIERGRFALVAGAGYELVLMGGGADDQPTRLLHGPRVTLSPLLVDPPRPTGDGGLRKRRFGLQLGLANWYAPDDDAAFVVTGGIVWGGGL